MVVWWGLGPRVLDLSSSIWCYGSCFEQVVRGLGTASLQGAQRL